MVDHKQFTSDEVSWSETTLFSSLIEDFKTLIWASFYIRNWMFNSLNEQINGSYKCNV